MGPSAPPGALLPSRTVIWSYEKLTSFTRRRRASARRMPVRPASFFERGPTLKIEGEIDAGVASLLRTAKTLSRRLGSYVR